MTPHRLELLSPSTVVARERVELRFRLTVGEAGLAAGGGLRLYPPVTTPPHFWSLVRWKLGLATVGALPAEAVVECYLARHDRGLYHETQAELVHVDNRGRALRPGESFELILSDCRAQAFAMARAPFHVEVDAAGEGDAAYVSAAQAPRYGGGQWQARLNETPPVAVEVVGAAPHRLVLALPSKPTPDGGLWLGLRAEDKYGNLASLPPCRLLLTPSAAGLELARPVLEWPDGPCCLRLEQAGQVTAPGTYWVDAAVADSELAGTSNVISTEIEAAVQFGDIHGHTYASDGLGTQDEYFRYARDQRFAELTCLTDHQLFDAQIVALTEQHNAPGRFVTLFGREWSDSRRGHRNVYGEDAAAVAAVDGPEVFELARGRDLLIVPHHTNAATKNYWRHADLSYHDEQLERLIEVSQNRGSFEVEERGGAVIDGGYGASVQSALARGMRLGFVGGSDTHRGTPSGPSHPLDPYYNTWNGISGLTGVYSEELTREGVFAAMKRRLTYCTTGPRIVAWYTLNGLPPGSVMPLPAEVRIEVLIGGVAAIDLVEVLRNNEVVAATAPGVRVARVSFAEPPPGPCYYYVRARQTDGHYAYLSPVWCGL